MYGLTLKQITAIRALANAELSARNAELRAQIEAMRSALPELEKQSAAKGTALQEEIAKLRHHQQRLVHELKPVLKKRTNDSLDNGGKSIHATSIPMGGTPVYRLRAKRR